MPACPLQVHEEGRRGVSYAHVLRMRPDHMFLHRVPSVGTLFDGKESHSTHSVGRLLLYDDQMAAARREDAEVILLAPSFVFNLCATEADWRAACAAGGQPLGEDWRPSKCKDDGVPCYAMTLISVLHGFGPPRRWQEMPWRAAEWSNGRRGQGEWCIKRTNWANESGQPAHLTTSGMSC